MTSWGVKGGFPLISLPYANQVIGITQVQLAEDLCLLEDFKGRGGEWQRIAAVNSNVIEASVIDVGP